MIITSDKDSCTREYVSPRNTHRLFGVQHRFCPFFALHARAPDDFGSTPLEFSRLRALVAYAGSALEFVERELLY